MGMSVLALNCTLKAVDEISSTEKLLRELMHYFSELGVKGETVRVGTLNIKPGVTADEGDGDDWPNLRKRILAADILIIGSPIWLGQPSSIAKRVLERLDAFLGEVDEMSRMPTYGKVAAVAVVGNEDGAHHCHSQIFQALNDVGFTLAPGAGTYWVGKAMGRVDYKDLQQPSHKTDQTSRMLASNAVHLAHLIKNAPYEGLSDLNESTSNSKRLSN